MCKSKSLHKPRNLASTKSRTIIKRLLLEMARCCFSFQIEKPAWRNELLFKKRNFGLVLEPRWARCWSIVLATISQSCVFSLQNGLPKESRLKCQHHICQCQRVRLYLA